VLLDTADTGRASTLTDDLESLLHEAQQQGLIERATLSQTDAQYRAMWTLREAIPMAEKIEGHMVKHDIAVSTSLVPAFVEQAQAALQRLVPGCRIVCFGHLGDGNLHYNVQAPVDMDTEVFLAKHEAAIHALVYDLALSLGGTISAEHGIGQLKRAELGQRQSATRTAWMRAIKHALDPEQRFNPGRLVP
jgi:FAD/FMN-containing dehydrogenase